MFYRKVTLKYHRSIIGGYLGFCLKIISIEISKGKGSATSILGKENKKYKKWARCLPMLGNVLAHVGHGACPSWAESVYEKCPKH